MDAATEAKAIRPDSRVDFLANHLVVVAPKDAAPDAFDLTPAAFEARARRIEARNRRDQDGAGGRYAKDSLTKLGL